MKQHNVETKGVGTVTFTHQEKVSGRFVTEAGHTVRGLVKFVGPQASGAPAKAVVVDDPETGQMLKMIAGALVERIDFDR